MDEAEINSASQEVAPPEAETHTPQEQPPNQANDWQDKNWRVIRQRVNELEANLEKERREKEEILKQALASHKVAQVDEPEEPDEEYIPKGKVKRLAAREVEPLKKELEDLKKELLVRKQQDLVGSLKHKYPDFDEIVNPETIALFEEKEPELAKSISTMQDPYQMWLMTYKNVKAANVVSDLPEKRHQKEAEKKLEKNAKTMQSPQAIDKRPMAQAFRLTEEEKSKLWQEMNQYGNMASSVPYIN